MKRKPIAVDGVVVRLDGENVFAFLKQQPVRIEVNQLRVAAVVNSR